MNTALLNQGLSLANYFRQARKERRRNAISKQYEDLKNSVPSREDLTEFFADLDASDAKKFSQKQAKKLKNLRDSAGPLAQAAHVRLENAKKQLSVDALGDKALDFSEAKKRLSSATDDAGKKAKKLGRKARKQAAKTQKATAKATARTEKKLRKKAANVADAVSGKKAKKTKRKKMGFGLGLVALLAAIGAAVYYFLFRKDETPTVTTPPRVEEYAGKKDATLVYSTSSEDDVDTSAKAGAGDLAEEPAERDEELLADLDAQLEEHRKGEATEK